jgi:hypothetical protein
VYKKIQKDPKFDADDRNKFAGVSRRPWELCYQLVIVTHEHESDLEGPGEVALHEHPDFVDDGSDKWKFWRERDPSEPDFPVLRLTQKQHKIWEFVIERRYRLRDEMHMLGGVTKGLRDACLAAAEYNGTKGDGKVEFTRMWCWAGNMSTFADNWTFRRAVCALFSHKKHRSDLEVLPEDNLPPILIVLGRMLLDIQ